MELADYKADMMRCSRCSYCKWIPFSHMKSWRFSKGCPSVEYGKFHAYSAAGRMSVALQLLEGRTEYSEKMTEVVYRCQMCGACDVMCKVCRYLEPLQIGLELRANLAGDGEVPYAHMLMIESLRNDDNTMSKPKDERGKWAEDLDVKLVTTDQAEVVYHAGCRYSFDEQLWGTARTTINLLKKAGIDIGIMGMEEACCGGRAYDIGYQGEFTKFAEHNIDLWNGAGVKTVVTSCADCYGTFVSLYPAIGKKMNFQILHISQYLNQLIKEGRIKLTQEVPMKVTYHDPCHLGRLGEPYIPWVGEVKKIRNQLEIHDPPKPMRRGAKGIYDPPRQVLTSIPGLELVEMERIREYAWCCGAGGGVKEAYPDFALWTALERLEEATATGAEAIVTACPWCERNFQDAKEGNNVGLEIYDIVDLVDRAIE